MSRRPPRRQSESASRRRATIDHPDVTVTIERLVPGGVCLARDDSGVVFVTGALPGEEVLVSIDRKRGGVRHGHAKEILRPSANRIKPDCVVHPRCGGCDLLDLDGDARASAKQELVFDVLRRIARVGDEEKNTVLPLRRPTHEIDGARRRARAHVGEGNSLGFFAAQSHAVVDTPTCVALVPELATAWKYVREGDFVAGTSVEFLATSRGEVFLSSSPENAAQLERAVELQIAAGVCAYDVGGEGELDGKLKPADEKPSEESRSSAPNSEANFFAGERGAIDVIAPYAHGGPYAVDAATFVQASEFGARTIVEEVLFGAYAPVEDLASDVPIGPEQLGELECKPTTRVLELFAGAGHLSFPLASPGAQVTAIEGAPVSAAWLAANAETFAQSDPPPGAHVTAVRSYISPDTLSPEIQRECDAQILVADPPRSGIPNADALFKASRATRLVLVSCDLATGARDLGKAIAAGFKLERLVPIDAFARTSHLEWVATLVRAPSSL